MMTSGDGGVPVLRYLGFAILAIAAGLPLIGFLVVLTWGAILIPLAGLLVLTPLAGIAYLLGGQTPAADQEPQLTTDRPERVPE